EKQPWTETTWRQSLRGEGFRNLALALLSYKRFTGHMTFTMCVNFTDIFQKERNHAAHRH
ncbi:hypothetical protein RIJ96_004373, partial [Escherichia coli]